MACFKPAWTARSAKSVENPCAAEELTPESNPSRLRSAIQNCALGAEQAKEVCMTALAAIPLQMRAELDIFGFLVPWWLVLGVVAYLVAFALVRVMESLGWLRCVWHPPLFFVALIAFCFSLIGLLLTL